MTALDVMLGPKLKHTIIAVKEIKARPALTAPDLPTLTPTPDP